jgi:hypothetical protein
MENILNSFTACMAFENGISAEQAQSLTTWLENEGVLDYQILRETYDEPKAEVTEARPNLHLVEQSPRGVANDA